MVDLQQSLFDRGTEVVPGPLDAAERRHLGDGAWVELAREWVTGADSLFGRLVTAVPWEAEERWMYDRRVAVPRLVRFYGEGEPLPDPALSGLREALNRHYGLELGEPFVTSGLCLYRDGRDSVAWHGDTIGRGSTVDTMVAIVSLGARRRFLLRRRGGGPSHRLDLGGGDLLVMGGSAQRTFEHSIPKTRSVAGARLSVQFRPRAVG